MGFFNLRRELLRIDNGQLKKNTLEILTGLYINLLEGESLGIIFDNLNEKEALIKILQADISLTYGRLYINERIITDGKIIYNNVYVINKKSILIQSLNIFENIYFSQMSSYLPANYFYKEIAEDLFNRFQINIPIDKPVSQLTHYEAISVELMKAYTLNKKIIVLSDISSYLTASELDYIMNLVEQMKKVGYSFIIIESFWDMIFKHTDNIAIVKHGRTRGFYKPSDLNGNNLKSILWQDDSTKVSPVLYKRLFEMQKEQEDSIRFTNVYTTYLKEINFSIKKGELLKILYLDEQSCSDFLSLLRGDNPLTDGTILLSRKLYKPPGIKDAQLKGICFVEENPQEKMLFNNLSIFDNFGFQLSHKVHWLWLKKNYQRSIKMSTEEICGEDLWDIPIKELSPVQLLKIIYCRQILFNPALVVCINPFTGMDYQVDRVINEMMQVMLKKKISILVVASYLPSSIAIDGKLLYLHEGRLSEDLKAGNENGYHNQ